MTDRRTAWRKLYSETLPSLARSKNPAQPVWPVTLDHCFGRIILDHVVGEGQTAWNKVIKGPAVKTMTDDQVEECIVLGEKISKGEVDLVQLDEESLRARGKKSKHFEGPIGGETKPDAKGTKRKRSGGPGDEMPARQLKGSEDEIPSKHSSSEASDAAIEDDSKKVQSPNHDTKGNSQTQKQDEQKVEDFAKKQRANASLSELQSIVKSSSLAPYRKDILLALLQVPKGKHTTYGAISDFLGSSPRAVGNGMRHNPFAPEVPCHRVLAANGKIGGYCGQWGEGDLIEKKIRILREEGVRFDGKGKVVGEVWRGFK